MTNYKAALTMLGTAIVVLSAGCISMNKTTVSDPLRTTPVVPAANEQVVLDQILVLVDVTGSMAGGKFHHAKSLVRAFAGAMPEGTYLAGISSFSGSDMDEWVQCPLEQYNRATLNQCVNDIDLLGSTTPLDRAIRMLAPQFQAKTGKGALVVFSDGLVPSENSVLAAVRNITAAHHGQLCVYTVHIGDSEKGQAVLSQMVRVAECGHAWNSTELNSAAAIEAMARAIFFGPKPPPPPPPPPAAPREIVLQGEVLFDFDSDVLKPVGQTEVDKVVAILKQNPNESVLIEGHTCDLGTAAYNMDLSQRRANSVRNYMVSQGISQARITTAAFGESRPAVPNTNEANRKLNRRITFVIQ